VLTDPADFRRSFCFERRSWSERVREAAPVGRVGAIPAWSWLCGERHRDLLDGLGRGRPLHMRPPPSRL